MNDFWNKNNEYAATNRAQMWLHVSYDEHEKAKAKGAMWDTVRRQWFVPHGIDAMLFRKWWPTQVEREYRAFEKKEKASKSHRQNPGKARQL